MGTKVGRSRDLGGDLLGEAGKERLGEVLEGVVAMGVACVRLLR